MSESYFGTEITPEQAEEINNYLAGIEKARKQAEDTRPRISIPLEYEVDPRSGRTHLDEEVTTETYEPMHKFHNPFEDKS